MEEDMASDINIVEWWKQNKEKHPILWKLVQVFLAIPATAGTSALLENIVMAGRNCLLSPKLVEASHLLHENAWLVQKMQCSLLLKRSKTK